MQSVGMRMALGLFNRWWTCEPLFFFGNETSAPRWIDVVDEGPTHSCSTKVRALRFLILGKNEENIHTNLRNEKARISPFFFLLRISSNVKPRLLFGRSLFILFFTRSLIRHLCIVRPNERCIFFPKLCYLLFIAGCARQPRFFDKKVTPSHPFFSLIIIIPCCTPMQLCLVCTEYIC